MMLLISFVSLPGVVVVDAEMVRLSWKVLISCFC